MIKNIISNNEWWESLKEFQREEYCNDFNKHNNTKHSVHTLSTLEINQIAEVFRFNNL